MTQRWYVAYIGEGNALYRSRVIEEDPVTWALREKAILVFVWPAPPKEEEPDLPPPWEWVDHEDHVLHAEAPGERHIALAGDGTIWCAGGDPRAVQAFLHYARQLRPDLFETD